MSSAPAAHAQEAHAFDGEPVDVLPDDEPRTPGWLTVAGLVLFVGVGIVLLAGEGAEPPAAKTPTMVVQQAQVAPPQAAPSPAGAPGTTRRLTVDDFAKPGQPNARPGGAMAPRPLPPGFPPRPRAPQPAH